MTTSRQRFTTRRRQTLDQLALLPGGRTVQGRTSGSRYKSSSLHRTATNTRAASSSLHRRVGNTRGSATEGSPQVTANAVRPGSCSQTRCRWNTDAVYNRASSARQASMSSLRSASGHRSNSEPSMCGATGDGEVVRRFGSAVLARTRSSSRTQSSTVASAPVISDADTGPSRLDRERDSIACCCNRSGSAASKLASNSREVRVARNSFNKASAPRGPRMCVLGSILPNA